MSKKLKKMPHLEGEVPYRYDRVTIYNMAILINTLSDAVNFLADEVERLEQKLEERNKEENGL